MEILHQKLIDYIDSYDVQLIDLPKAVHECGATDLVRIDSAIDWAKDSFVYSYLWEEHAFWAEREWASLYLLYYPGKSYLLYAIDHEVMVWVCYTIPSERKKGLMHSLLHRLTKICKRKTITIDTRDESLRKASIALGIKLFQR